MAEFIDPKTGEKTIEGAKTGANVDALGDGRAGTQLKTRITASDVLGTISEDMIPDKGEPAKWYLRIIGEISGYETGRTTFGPYVKLKGEFTSTDMRTGQILTGSTCILPGLAEMIVRRQLDVVNFGSENGPKMVTFGMEIGLDWNKPDIKMVDGKEIAFKKYMWAIRPLGSTVETPLMRLTRELNEKSKALALAAPSDPDAPLVNMFSDTVPTLVDESAVKTKSRR
jgi:hypothetical protein